VEIDRDALEAFTAALVRTPSPSGREGDVAPHGATGRVTIGVDEHIELAALHAGARGYAALAAALT
jgi:hypothetical protein